MTVAIRVSTEVIYGMGHFIRCLSIRSYINKKVIWFIDDRNKNIEDRIPKDDQIYFEKKSENFYKLKNLILEEKIDIILIDNYFININEIKKIDKNIFTVLILDKKSNIKANIIICPQPIDFNTSNKIKYLCGPKYAPISSNYKRKKNNTNFSHLLISFGSYDSKGLTLKVIQAVKNLILRNKYNFKTIITLGKYSPILKEVKSSIKNSSSFTLLLDTRNMEHIYNKCNIAIGAPGLSQLERMHFGIATLLVAQNTLHSSLANKWQNLGAAVKCKNSVSSIEKELLKLLKNNILLHNLISKGKSMVDGKGANRIADEINNLVSYND